jgi:predicted DNA-binding transcriptional regulator AlpA
MNHRIVRQVPEPPAVSVSERLWSVEDASTWLGVPVNTLYGWRTRGYGPRAVRVGRHLRYVPAEVRDWVLGQAS